MQQYGKAEGENEMMKGKALLMTLATVTALTVASPAGAAEGEGHDFGPLRIGIKMVTGKNGNDHGGELRGGKGEEMCRLMRELGCDQRRVVPDLRVFGLE